jgi:hypothetical protein
MDFERAYRNMEYGQQQREIEAVLSEDKKNILVGDYKLAEDEQTKESYTFTFWSQGAELFLPKVDFVLFTDSSGKRLADWDSVEKHLGDLMKPLFLYPPRYFVKGFPTPGQFKKMERAILRENNN